MRRTDHEITDESERLALLRAGKYVSIAMCRGGEPYIVTLNYGYDADANALYFHCAHEGCKINFITDNPAVCATVIEDRGYLAGQCAHPYRSLVLRGAMHVVLDLAEKKHGLRVLLNHLEDDPDALQTRHFPDDTAYERVGVLRLDIREISGKQGQ